MHYCFFSTGSWEKNASMMRPRDLGRELIARGVQVTYAVDDLPHNHEKLGVDPKATVVYTSRTTGLGQIAARRRTLRSINPDFVHVINPAPKTMSALWGTRHRLISDWDEWPAMRTHSFSQTLLVNYLDRWFRNRAVMNVVASQFMQREFARRYGVDALYLPYAAFLPEQPATTSPFTAPTFVYMGKFYPAYDQDIVFQAALLLKKQGLTPPIVFVGDGPDMEKWQAFIRDNHLDNIEILGFISVFEMWRRLRHAHVLLFPIRDTILNVARCPSKVFAFAQACRPVITNRVGEVPAVLGDKATYIDPTPQAFADAIASAINRDQPDVDYHVETQNWGTRAEKLIAALNRLP